MVKIELKKLLQDRSLYWLSKETRMRWQTLDYLARGKAKGISFQQIDRLCRALECEPGDLFKRTVRKPAK